MSNRLYFANTENPLVALKKKELRKGDVQMLLQVNYCEMLQSVVNEAQLKCVVSEYFFLPPVIDVLTDRGRRDFHLFGDSIRRGLIMSQIADTPIGYQNTPTTK